MLKKNPYAILVRNYHNKSLCKTLLSEYFMIKRFYDGTNISFRSLFNQHNESGEILLHFDVQCIDNKTDHALYR